MKNNTLVKLLKFRATLIHGDTLVLDRWRWLKKRLPKTKQRLKLFDVGCGSGAFTMGASKRGYQAVGLSWDKRNRKIAEERAKICNTHNATFEIGDVRKLDQYEQYKNRFDVAVCLEVIEHILNDQKVFDDIYQTLKPGGKLLLTTPYLHYKAIVKSDDGPFCTQETGWHVRRGYTADMLKEICKKSGFKIKEISYCSGFLSQKITYILWSLQYKNFMLAWLLIFPLRILPVLFDGMIRKLTKWPDYSIGIVAEKE